MEKIPPSNFGKARDKAAAIVGVNSHYVTDAKKIQEQAPKLIEEIKTRISY